MDPDLALLLNLGQFGILSGIFLRLGSVTTDITNIKRRVANLEANNE